MCIVDWIIAVAKNSMGGLAFYILMGIVIIFVISVIVTNKDKIHTILIVTIGAFYLFSKIYCGPSLIDIYRMKPMAEKISEYIVKNGIPKSLKDIPGLPYELEGCENIDDEKKCHYKKDSAYTVGIYIPITNELTVEIFNTDSRTGIQYWFKKDNTKIILERKGNAYSSKTSGICNSMRQ